MAEGLVARRLASLFPKGIQRYERDSDSGRGIPDESLRSGRGVPEAGQRIPAEGDVHREERGQMEHAPRVPAEGLESRELTYPDEHARREGLFLSFSCSIATSRPDKTFFFFFFSKADLANTKNLY